jgi:hypothetical protein
MKKKSIKTSMVWLWLRMAHKTKTILYQEKQSSEKLDRYAAAKNEQVAHAEARCE